MGAYKGVHLEFWFESGSLATIVPTLASVGTQRRDSGAAPLTAVAHSPTPAAQPIATSLLPDPTARQLIDPAGQLSSGAGALPAPGVLRELYRRMVIGR